MMQHDALAATRRPIGQKQEGRPPKASSGFEGRTLRVTRRPPPCLGQGCSCFRVNRIAGSGQLAVLDFARMRSEVETEGEETRQEEMPSF
jgi:hypothetical protein